MSLVQINNVTEAEVLEQKYKLLCEILREMGSVVIGLSGGADSALLSKVAHDVLGERALAVIGDSETFPAQELEDARNVAIEIGIRWIAMPTHELSKEEFASNPIDRCYYCKSELFSKLNEVAVQHGMAWAVDGGQADDLKDYRPGMKAGKENQVRSPLLEAGIGKKEIRILSRRFGLPTAEKPGLACLSSRFPYGTRITRPNLLRIDQAESFIRSQGFKQVRVRFHDEQTARIEIPSDEFGLLLDPAIRNAVVARLTKLGFPHVTLDLKGYRMGSMNEGIVAD